MGVVEVVDVVDVVDGVALLVCDVVSTVVLAALLSRAAIMSCMPSFNGLFRQYGIA